MDSVKLIETMGTGGATAGNTGLAAAAGAFFGSWFGDNAGFGRGGYGTAAGVGAGSVGGGVIANTLTDPALLDAIHANGTKLDQATISNLQGFNALQNTSNQGFAGLQNSSNQGFSGLSAAVNTTSAMTQNSLSQGFAGVNNAITTGDLSLQNTLGQGFNGLNTAIVTQGYESRLASGQVVNAINECCCKTNANIIEQGCATRELIKEVQTQGLRDKLCERDATIAALNTKSAVAEAITAQSVLFDAKLNNLAATIIQHVVK